MNKEEFLAELKACLAGKMSAGEIESNVDYYRAYIEGEIMKGRSEQEVLEELGPARFIAKTLTVNIKDDEASGGQHESRRSEQGNDNYNEGSSDEPYEDPSIQKSIRRRRIISGIIIAVIIILIILLLGSMFRGIIYLVFRFLPIIVIFALFSWIYRGRGRG